MRKTEASRVAGAAASLPVVVDPTECASIEPTPIEPTPIGPTSIGPTMATDHIRYDVLARDALRGVLRRVLSDAAAHGLPGEHHFFITFVSSADGVKLSPRLFAQYPEEMTIILQHQFWDLVVTEDRFEVGLSFGGIPERLVVPFAAIKSFFDPSVQFGLQFEPPEAVAEAPAKNLPAAPPAPAAASGPAAAVNPEPETATE